MPPSWRWLPHVDERPPGWRAADVVVQRSRVAARADVPKIAGEEILDGKQAGGSEHRQAQDDKAKDGGKAHADRAEG
jgi:hypothetical protein